MIINIFLYKFSVSVMNSGGNYARYNDTKYNVIHYI